MINFTLFFDECRFQMSEHGILFRDDFILDNEYHSFSFVDNDIEKIAYYLATLDAFGEYGQFLMCQYGLYDYQSISYSCSSLR